MMARHLRQLRHLSTYPDSKLVNQILALPSNRAVRYVYMRTIPLAQQPELSEEEVVKSTAASIRSSLESVIAKYATKELDTRGSVHLHSAGLAIATHHVLAPTLGKERVTELVRAAFGVGRTLPAHTITKTALWFSPNRMRAARKMAENARNDFGPEFDSEVVDDSDDAFRLVVKKCYYKRLFDAEGMPELTKVFCELDKALFSPISESLHKIEFQLAETLADGDEQCNFKFHKVQKK